MKLIRIPLIAAAALALAACGGGHDGAGAHLTSQNDAANALFNSNQAYSNGSQQSLVLKAAQSAVASGSASGSVTVKCRGGNGSVTADVTVNGSGSGGTGTLDATVKLSYDDCEAGDYIDGAGKNGGAVYVGGTVNWATTLSGSGSSFAGNVTINGELDFSGGINDKVVANNVQVDVSATSGAAGSQATVSITGTITTNESSFTFNAGDTVTFTSGTFSGTVQAGNT